MLVDLLKEGYGNKEGLNCAQKILHASNEVYQLGLSQDALLLSGGFGGGMGIESTCGAITAGVMVLSKLFPIHDEDSKKYLYALSKEFVATYFEKMGYIDCVDLKTYYRTEQQGCSSVVEQAALILDEIIQREIHK